MHRTGTALIVLLALGLVDARAQGADEKSVLAANEAFDKAISSRDVAAMEKLWELGLLGVRNNGGDDIGIIFDLEIKTPGFVDAGLPEVFSFVVLLGVQRRVEQVGR